MTSLLRLMAASILIVASALGFAETESTPAQPYQHEGRQYPPILFATNAQVEDFKSIFESFGAFAEVDNESVGIPIGVRVLRGKRTKQDGASFSSAMLSASTLGLIPMVSNKEFKVLYDVFVQGRSIAQFTYQLDSTDVDHMWVGGIEHNKTSEGEAVFLRHSVSMFLNDIKEHEEVQAVFAEYWEYFGEE